MSSILSQYKVYFHPHKPFLFSWHLLLSSVSRLSLCVLHDHYTIEQMLLGAHGSLVHIIFITCIASTLLNFAIVTCLAKHIATKPYGQLLVHYYMTPSIYRKGVKTAKGPRNKHRLCPMLAYVLYLIRGTVTAHFLQES